MTTPKANRFPSSLNLDSERQKVRIMKIMFGLFSIILLVSLLLSFILSH